ncbi:hypothetical protein J3B02_002390, partial [Coemansia erecta]
MVASAVAEILIATAAAADAVENVALTEASNGDSDMDAEDNMFVAVLKMSEFVLLAVLETAAVVAIVASAAVEVAGGDFVGGEDILSAALFFLMKKMESAL